MPELLTLSQRSPGKSGPSLMLRSLSMIVVIGFAFPASYLVWRNFTDGGQPFDLLTSRRTTEPLIRTLKLAFAVSTTSMVLGSSLAWLTARTDLPLLRFWRIILPVPLVFPTFIGAAAFIRTFAPGGLAHQALGWVGIDFVLQFRGFFGAWFVLTLFTYPYVYLPVSSRFRQLPSSMEESARLLGDAPFTMFRRIILPQTAGAIGAGTLLVFLYTISDFGAVQLLRYDTLTRAIATNQLANPPAALALSLALLVLAAIVVSAERATSRRLPTLGDTEAGRAVRYSLGRWKTPSVGLAALAAGLGVVAPFVALLDWASGALNPGSRGLTVDTGKVVDATWNTLHISVLAAVAAILAVLPIALLVGRYQTRGGALAHAVVISSFALPGILIALAMRFWILRSDVAFDLFSDTKALLIFAYVVRFGSLAMGVTLIAVKAVPQQLNDAARMLGATAFRRFVSIDLPLMRPGLLAAAGLVLLSTMKELPISLLIAPLGFSTLATRTFSSFEEAFVVEAGLMAVVLVVLSFALSWALVLRRADDL